MRNFVIAAMAATLLLTSCGKKETAEAPKQEAPAQTVGGPRVSVHLKDGNKVPGTIVASSQTDMTVAGDDGIERKIPMEQVQSVEYGAAPSGKPAARERGKVKTAAQKVPKAAAPPPAGQSPMPAPPVVTTRTYELPVGTEVSVRTNETIDSKTAAEGQTFDSQVTRDLKDTNGDLVIPKGSTARVLIKSATKGSRFHGASDLVLDLQTVTIDGKQYTIDTTNIEQKGKSGIGANKRTAEYTGGGAALGAIIGAIAGGGKGAAIGAGAGAGAGAITQVITKGGAIKVPAETVLTFKLDRPLRVTSSY